MYKKILILFSVSIFSLVIAGCDGGTAQMAPKEANLLGIATLQEESYLPTGPNTFAVSTEDLYSRRNFQGSKATFLWGLVTLKDY